MSVSVQQLKITILLKAGIMLFFILLFPLAVVAGNDTTLLPIDSLSSEDTSNTSLQSSEEESLSSQNAVLVKTIFSNIYQEDIIIGEPVVMYQLITLTNQEDDEVLMEFSLADYPDFIPTPYLTDAKHIAQYVHGELVSETTQATLLFLPQETKEIFVYYTYVPVEQTMTCERKKIADIIPSQAQIISTTIGLGADLYDVCTLTLSHDTTISYYDVTITLDDLNPENIVSVYYVQGDQYLFVQDNAIYIPKP